ncbi:NAD-dependent epimerase/dehydratase family protein [Anabaena azotica]|uniref:NAD-dependent epimerase/dehydratase family protein n=1 Tax=Anabaena azotica TaxID=197653 RepID=UPI0039A49184
MASDSNFKVFILGGQGFVGSAYARWAVANQIDYTVITRDNYAEYVGSSCDLFINANGNSRKYLAKESPLEEFDASVRSVKKSLIDFHSNCYIHLSSCDVYPDCSQPSTTKEDNIINISQQSPYGFHKYLAEQCVIHSHSNWIIFRMGGFVGNGMKKNPIFDILQGQRLWVHPQSQLQYINTDAAASIVLELALSGKYKNEIFNICGEGLIELMEVINLVGSQVKVEPNSPKVNYEISLEKIQQVVKLPQTRETVLKFVENQVGTFS